MHNCYFIMMASAISMLIASNCIVSVRIDSTLGLINEQMVADCVSEKSKMSAYSENDISLLAINHDALKDMVDFTLDKNLSFLKHEAKYYYYDKDSKTSCKIGDYSCNSVQIMVKVKYNNKLYEGFLRYEPTKIGD